MRRGIPGGDGPVRPLAEDLPVAHDDGAHGHLAGLGRPLRESEGAAHEADVVEGRSGLFVHSHSMVAGGLLEMS